MVAPPTFFPASMAMSNLFHLEAREAVRRLHRRRWDADVAGAIVMSVAAAHAGINELATFHGLHQSDRIRAPTPTEGPFAIPRDVAQAWRMIVPIITGGPTFERRSELWRDFVDLVALRNALVHFAWGGPPPGFMVRLHRRGVVEQTDVVWQFAILTTRVAVWAVDVVADLFTQLRRLDGRDGNALWSGWDASNFPRFADDREPPLAP